MKLNRLGLILLIIHTVLIVGVATVDGIFTPAYRNELSGIGAKFWQLVIIADLPAIPLMGVLGKVFPFPMLGIYYVKYGWVFVLHFVVFGGLQYYLIGWLASKWIDRSKRKTAQTGG